MRQAEVRITYPVWAVAVTDFDRRYASDDERMALVLGLARENVARDWGGPFAAAVFERRSGRLISIGVNSVVRMSSSLMHAEIIALAMAHSATRSHSLGAEGLPAHELVTSCDPCSMCLGAVLWSGVQRLVCSARRDDAQAVGFDEGLVTTDASFAHLAERGVEIVREQMRAEGRAVLKEYRDARGLPYDG